MHVRGSADGGPGDITIDLTSEVGAADFDLWRLDEGHAYEELAAHIAEEQRRFEEGLPGLGHPGFATLVAEASVDPETGAGLMSVALEPGEYGMACIPIEGGVPSAILAAGPFIV